MKRVKRKLSKNGQVRCPTCDVERMILGWWVESHGRKVYRRTLPSSGATLYRCNWCGCCIAVMPEDTDGTRGDAFKGASPAQRRSS